MQKKGKHWRNTECLPFFFVTLWRWGELNPRPKNAAFGVMRTENSGCIPLGKRRNGSFRSFQLRGQRGVKHITDPFFFNP